MNSIISKIKKNKKIHFFVKAFKHINQEEYLDFFINRENEPLLIEFQSRGEKCKDDRICFIHEVGVGYGYFAEFHTMLQELAFADYFNLTPFIYWGEKFLYYEQEMINETKNAFEYFFYQPSRYTKQEVDRADLLTEAKIGQARWIEERYNRGYDLSDSYLNMISSVYNKYVCLNERTSQKLKKEIDELLKGKETLAIHYRGTDFKVNYDNHPVCVQIVQEINVVKEAMNQYPFEQLFIATDDLSAISVFKKEFGEKIVCYNDVVRGEGNVSVALSKAARERHHYFLAYEVLRDMYTLSASQGLIAGVSQVSICARIVKRANKEKYLFEKIIDNGKNYNNKKFQPVKLS